MINKRKENRKANFPTLTEVKAGVEEILRQNWTEIKFKSSAKLYFKRLEKIFLSKLGLLPFGILQSDTQQLNPICYRVRKGDVTLNPNIISDFSHPPQNLCKKFQRASLPKSPVFYCSPDAKTAIIETLQNNFNPNDKNLYFISEWSFRPNYKLNIAPFLYGNTSPQNTFKSLGDTVLERFKSEHPEMGKENIEVFQEILKFLAGLFVYENTYTISSFIGYAYLYTLNSYRADIFMYPSTQTERHTVNFAIHPNTVVDKMVLKKVFCLKINQFDYNNLASEVTLKLRAIKVGKNENGIIFWRDFTKEDIEDLKKIFPEQLEDSKPFAEAKMNNTDKGKKS